MNFLIPQNLKNAAGVYSIDSPRAKSIYIGATVCLINRYRTHLAALRGNAHDNHILQGFCDEVGLNSLRFRLIEAVEEHEIHCLASLEQKWIDAYSLSPLLNRTLVSAFPANAKAPVPTTIMPVRLPPGLLAKLEVVAKYQRRKRGELIRMLVEDAVAAHEAKHGEIKLPEQP
jgi:hypothetical protein